MVDTLQQDQLRLLSWTVKLSCNVALLGCFIVSRGGREGGGGVPESSSSEKNEIEKTRNCRQVEEADIDRIAK